MLLLLSTALLLQGQIATWTLGPFTRAEGANPVLKPDPSVSFACPMRKTQVAWESDNVFNPAAAVRNGHLVVLFRAEDHSGDTIGAHTSRVGYAESTDGFHFTRRQQPVLFPAEDDQKKYDWPGGCEDPRLVETPDGYLLMYTSWNKQTARLCSATSHDLLHWDKKGPVFAKTGDGKYVDQWSKSGSVVTERKGDHLVAAKIRGQYWMFYGEGTVFLAHSTNLIYWDPVTDSSGAPVPILAPRANLFDSALCEAGPPAVVTGKGIVLIYNGKNDDAHGDKSIPNAAYSAGQALMDRNDLAHVVARTSTPFLTPTRSYETSGQYHGGTVFVEGLAAFKHKWWLYYGTADTNVAVATAPIEEK